MSPVIAESPETINSSPDSDTISDAQLDPVIRITLSPSAMTKLSASKMKNGASKQSSSKKKLISKDKGYVKKQAINKVTGRQNQVLECLTCDK